MLQKANQQLVLPSLVGAAAGFTGTIFMTIFMLLMHRLLPAWQRYALPPEELTKEAADRAGIGQHMDKPQLLTASLVSHFAYGMAAGTLYTTVTRNITLPSALKGIIFGLVIWAGSYLGWLPLAHFSEAASEEPIRRNLLMIAAHIIWGVVTGTASDAIAKLRV